MSCSLRGIKKKVSAHGLRPVYRGAYIRYFIINPSIFCCPLFSENYLNSKDRINQVVNKHTVDYHPSPSQLISRILPLIFRLTPTGLIFPESLLIFFLKPVYSTMVADKFQIYSIKITATRFLSQKIESVHFYWYPQVKLSAKFLSLSPRQTGISYSSQTAFFEDIFF